MSMNENISKCEKVSISSLISNKSICVIAPSFKVSKDNFKIGGRVPIVSQEADYISGYYDIEDPRICNGSYVCFGDHTEHIKFINFKFVQGADGLKILHVDREIIEPKFLYYALLKFYKKQCNYERHFKHLGKTHIPLPPLKEQQAIVEVLESFDEYIKNLEALVAKKRDIRDGALQDLMSGRVRVDGFSGEWKEYSLNELASILNGDRGVNYPSDIDYVSSGIPFVNAGHIEDGSIDWSTMNFISEDRYNALSGGKIQSNDILFCLRGSLGKCVLVNFAGGAPASSLCIIRARKAVDAKFLAYLVNSPFMRAKIDMDNTGSSQPNLSAKDISNFLFKVPSHEEQQAIAEILTSMDDEIESLEAEKEKWEQIRDGAMDDLLSGKVRVSK